MEKSKCLMITMTPCVLPTVFLQYILQPCSPFFSTNKKYNVWRLLKIYLNHIFTVSATLNLGSLLHGFQNHLYISETVLSVQICCEYPFAFAFSSIHTRILSYKLINWRIHSLKISIISLTKDKIPNDFIWDYCPVPRSLASFSSNSSLFPELLINKCKN